MSVLISVVCASVNIRKKLSGVANSDSIFSMFPNVQTCQVRYVQYVI